MQGFKKYGKKLNIPMAFWAASNKIHELFLNLTMKRIGKFDNCSVETHTMDLITQGNTA